MDNVIKQSSYRFKCKAFIKNGFINYEGKFENQNIQTNSLASEFRLDKKILTRTNKFIWAHFITIGIVFVILMAGYIADYHDVSILVFLTSGYLFVLFFSLFRTKIKFFTLSSPTQILYFLANAESKKIISQIINHR